MLSTFLARLQHLETCPANPCQQQEAFEKCWAHSPDVASGTVARRLRIDVHDNADDNDNDDNDNA